MHFNLFHKAVDGIDKMDKGATGLRNKWAGLGDVPSFGSWWYPMRDGWECLLAAIFCVKLALLPGFVACSAFQMSVHFSWNHGR